MKGIVTALALVAALLSGCASVPGTSLEMTAQLECERYGAVWRAALAFCEVQAGGDHR
ncbi:MAG: hypothetical protein HY726_03415 [Candidatus Rokubacteria bacterium]|nr:hypothetical protein [Candidatus Rokubacteria bacterium]